MLGSLWGSVGGEKLHRASLASCFLSPPPPPPSPHPSSVFLNCLYLNSGVFTLYPFFLFCPLSHGGAGSKRTAVWNIVI